ncbi:MAG: hypothetical protein WDA70_08385 [Lysobacteraceae bacterium]
MNRNIKSVLVIFGLLAVSLCAHAASVFLDGYGQASTYELAVQLAEIDIQNNCAGMGGQVMFFRVVDSGYQFGEHWVMATANCVL